MVKSIMRRMLEQFAPFLRSEVKRVLLYLVLDPLRNHDQDYHNLGVESIYAVVDIFLERETQKTWNKLDDAIIRGFLDALFESAKRSGIASEMPE